MDALRNLIVNAGVHIGCLLWTIVAIILSPFVFLVLGVLTGKSRNEIARILIWYYGRGSMLIVSVFIPMSIVGNEHVDQAKSYIFIINHQSFLDLYLMGAQPIRNLLVVVRDWPFRIPGYGPFMRMAGYANAESNDLEKVLERCKQGLRQGASVVFFPEGTRSKTGDLGRFYSGAFKLSIETGVPVLPFCIWGSKDFMAKGSVYLRYASVFIRFLPPVHPEMFKDSVNSHVAMRKYVKGLMACNINEMKDEQDTIAKTPQTEWR